MTTPAPTSTAPVRLFYVDDSGAESTGYISYSWMETTPDGWRTLLRTWLDLRRDLYAKYKIHPSTEVHTTKFVAGRQRPSSDPKVNRSKALREQATEMMLAAIGTLPEAGIGTVYRQTTARGKAFFLEKADLYGRLVDHLDQRLDAANELGIVFMDGDGSASDYYNAHRDLKLATRRVIEDPLFQASHRSQPVQIADLVAWTTYQHLLRHPGKLHIAGWYDTYLRPADVNGGPLQL